MLQRDLAAAAQSRPADLNPVIQYISIELGPLADGRVFVGISATICEREGQLENMDMGSSRVGSIEEALTVIREAIASSH